ncbi:hypothetical protein M1K46_03115 [Fictibacillus sp. WQ 8-8]|uniref:Uncharacterized protein n=1 Tax=Fictibacillus marinisediminis TaxID=2878389 RepID=A0A9X2BES1_9BACL|nr:MULTISPECIES: hypothetical protein [Fictibacillus]MCK6258956.1 hypothetical protein [Fictibacillus marinisediminis]MCQ6264656.1 hypothetical protein [Fictibacillus sp. WQ 8-8]
MSPRTNDVVLIVFESVPRTRRFRISDFAIIGSAGRCKEFLKIGEDVVHAESCLLRNNFRVVFESSNILLFVRN